MSRLYVGGFAALLLALGAASTAGAAPMVLQAADRTSRRSRPP
jgi:hypothetical protein